MEQLVTYAIVGGMVLWGVWLARTISRTNRLTRQAERDRGID